MYTTSKKSKKIALCGVLSALSFTFLLIGAFIPLATYIAPAIAAILVLPISYEYKEKTAFTLYITVSILSILFIPEKEVVMLYVFVFGLYSVFKFRIDIIKSKFIKLIIKIVYSCISLLVCYAILFTLFSSLSLTKELLNTTWLLVILFFLVFCFTFILYDFAATICFKIYYYKLRNRLIG